MSEEPNTSGEQVEEAAALPSDVEQTPVDTGQTETHEPKEEYVPLSALKSERAERQKMNDELREMKEYMSLMARQQQAAQPKEDEFSGRSKDDVITYGELESLLSKKEQQYQMSIKELKMTQKYPDYEKIVTKYLPEVLKQQPGLRDTLSKTQDYELAYYLAKNSDIYKSENKSAKKSADAERIVQNANRAGSLSSVGQTSPISAAKRYREMSDSEFKQQVQKNLGYY